MARGWESKSVEDQLEERLRVKQEAAVAPKSPEAVEREGRRETLLLMRSRLLDQLQHVRTDAHRRQIEQSLQAIEVELAAL
ncbi:MAG TPA: hypothetical protein PLD20_06790 [Blastocatellia bacterium]|nr:hypothetical protein [Blastocatellia bacterium]HMX26079.1 hypothetical protein [Blastocatellia bacterium]HMY75092.1 hypothetical protein [Blastocatellia bacterium]HMZ17615.1 hypothetical protein [Blastocatellia bacterium]HNG29786.1 hypothetical protein [Blastocatellia bacterium]